MSYVLGRNCRFLQGPKTSPHSVARLRDAISAGKESYEVFLNYRRDGSPFLNLLMTAPLMDSRGQIRYFIGAQVDVSGIAKDCTDLESLRRLVNRENGESEEDEAPKKPEFQELSEMLNLHELDTVRRFGGKMHRDSQDEDSEANGTNWHKPRLMLSETEAESAKSSIYNSTRLSGKLSGVYQNVRCLPRVTDRR